MSNHSTMEEANCSSSCRLTDDFPVCIGSSAVLGLCFVLGVPGNIAVLVMLVRRLKEKNFTLSLMLSLAVSDLLTLLPVPVWIWASLNGWIFGSVGCKIAAYVEYWSFYCSSLCVTLMSIQRYMQVLHSQKWAKLGDQGKKGLLGGIWIMSGLLASYIPVQYDVGCAVYGFHDCFKTNINEAQQIVTLFLEILLFFICFSLIVIFYYRLHREINETLFFSSSRVTKLVMRIIVVFFILCILVPIANVLIIVSVLLNENNLSVMAQLFNNIAEALTFLNCCVNPFLYAFSFKELQCCRAVTEDT